MDSGPDLIRELLVLEARRATGQLEVQSDAGVTLIFFMRGSIVYAEGGGDGDTLGRVMMREGAISRKQYGEIIAQMTDQLVEHEQMRFGEVGIRLGFVTPEQVAEGLRWQVRSRVFGCLQHDHTVRYFDEGYRYTEGVPSFPIELGPALRSAVELFYDRPRLRATFLVIDKAQWRLADPNELGRARFGFTTQELDVARRLREPQRLGDLLETPRGPATALTMRVLLLLWLAGLVVEVNPHSGEEEKPPVDTERPTERPPAPRDRRKTAMTATLTEHVEDTSVPLARPDTVPPPPRPLPRAPDRAAAMARAKVLERLAKRPRRAAETVVDPVPDKAGLEARSPESRALEAASRFEGGRNALIAGNHEHARTEFAAAQELHPTDEHALHLAWADFLCKTGGESVLQREVVREQAEASLRVDRRLAFGHYVMGRLAILDEDFERAEKALKVANALDADASDAARYLRLLRQRRQRKK